MSDYPLTKRCKTCGYQITSWHTIYGDFDGWEDWDRVLKNCPVCRATAELKAELAQRLDEEIKRRVAHSPDCAIALNGRHECSCSPNASDDRQLPGSSTPEPIKDLNG